MIFYDSSFDRAFSYRVTQQDSVCLIPQHIPRKTFRNPPHKHRKPIFAHAAHSILIPRLILISMLLGSLPFPAIGADFTVASETELLQAIDDANTSSDRSSAITLSDSFMITGSGLSPIDKNLVINMDGHTLTSSFEMIFNVVQGATLTLDSSSDVTGTSGFNGFMTKTGEGTLWIKGGSSDLFWQVTTNEGLLVFDGGAIFTFKDISSDDSSTELISEIPAGIHVTGPGTVITNRHTATLQASAEDSREALPAATEHSSEELDSGDDGQNIEERGEHDNFWVAGKDSRWRNDSVSTLTPGSRSVLDGGSLETVSLRAGYFDTIPAKDAIARILVSSAGSTSSITGTEPDAFITIDGDGYLRSTSISSISADSHEKSDRSEDSDNDGDANEPTAEALNTAHQPAPLYQAGVPLYQNYPAILQGLNYSPTLQQRIGNRHQNYDDVAYPAIAGDEDNPSDVADRLTVWNRINTAHAHSTPTKSTIGITGYSLRSWRFDTGVEGLLLVKNGGRLIGGISGHHMRTSAEVSSAYGDGVLDITGTGTGATLTWYGKKGVYLDGSAQATWYRSNLRSTGATQTLANDNHGFGYALSTETGVRIILNNHFFIIPQAQLTYSSVTFDPFLDSLGARISPRRSKNLAARFGLETNYGTFWETRDGRASANIYSVMNLHYNLHGSNKINVSGVNFYGKEPRAKASFGLGGSLNWGDGKFAIHGEVLHQFALAEGRNHITRGQLGLKIRF